MIMACENAEVVFIREAKSPTKLYIPSTISINMNLACIFAVFDWIMAVLKNYKVEEL